LSVIEELCARGARGAHSLLSVIEEIRRKFFMHLRMIFGFTFIFLTKDEY